MPESQHNAPEAAVLAAISRLELAGSRLLVAVSGGADSVCLLHLLATLRDVTGITLHVAHLNHQLRGSQSDDDASWVAARCGELQVPATIEVADVGLAARTGGRGVEETARDLRYRFLRQTARRLHCPAVATAHTADDQAETILHHIVRGTGLRGLRGMPAQRSLDENTRLVRPLLEVTRGQIEAWLERHQVPFRTDATNADTTLTRNRIRHQLLPMLREEFNPDVSSALLRLGQQAAQTQAAVEFAAEALLQQCMLERSPDRIELQCGPLAGVPRHLVRACFVLLWQTSNWPQAAWAFRDWDRLAALAAGEAVGSVSLPGRVQATRRADRLQLLRGHPPEH